MKLFLASFLLLSSTATFAETCRVLKDTKSRHDGGPILKGSIAVTRTGEHVGVQEILKDTMFFFKDENGVISRTYQWMYNPINKVANREDKYLATSFGEDVIVTVGVHDDKPGQVTVKYTGTRSGNYLNLICE